MFDELFAKRPPNKIKPGLERIRAAYEHLGKPGHSTKTVLVAGTNGKGTTAGFLTRYLESSGQRVGLYTSPHLVHLSERFYISHRSVTDQQVLAIYEELDRRLPASIWSELSFFEVVTLIAMLLFEEANVETRILEVGLGGRWDATNVVEPELSLITSIGVDHTEFLGCDIKGIAREKAGVMRPHRPTLVGDVPAPIRAVLEESARQVGAHAKFLGHSPSTIDYLQHNRELAWRASGYLVEIRDKNIVREADLPLSGRFQSLAVSNGGRRNLLLDVCHNVAGAEAFAVALQRRLGQGPYPAFISIMGDKDVDGILDVLRSILSPIVLFQSDNVRSFNRLRVGPRHRDLSFFDNFNDAFTWSVAQWQNERPWIICGSVATVGEVLNFFGAEKAGDGADCVLLGRSPVPLPDCNSKRP